MFNPCDCSSSLKGAPFKVLKLFPPKVLGARGVFLLIETMGNPTFKKTLLVLLKCSESAKISEYVI